MEMQNKIINDYKIYFLSIFPQWQEEPYDLILKLVNLNDINSIKFLVENADQIFSMKNYSLSSEDIIANYSNIIGRLNRVDLLNSDIELDYTEIVNGAIEGKNYNMFLYGFEKIEDELINGEITQFIELAAANQNLEVLKYLFDSHGDEFYGFEESLLYIAISDNLTDTLRFLVEEGISTLDSLKHMASKGKFKNDKNLMNFIQSYTILGKRKTREEHMEIIPKRQRIV